MTGHGHVTPNPGGAVARCGGPAICGTCALELANAPKAVREAYYEKLDARREMRVWTHYRGDRDRTILVLTAEAEVPGGDRLPEPTDEGRERIRAKLLEALRAEGLVP